MEILKYDQNNRPVYRNLEAPHEEDRQLYCPNPCKFKDDCWNYPCIESPELEKIKSVGQLCFRGGDIDLTCEQIEECFNRHMPSYTKACGSGTSDNYIQVIWYDNICPVNLIRNIIGDDLSCIEDIEFKMLDNLQGYYFDFDCYDLEEAEEIKQKYLDAVNADTDNQATIKLKVVYYGLETDDENDDYVNFYFELEDREMNIGIENFCEELNLIRE